MPPKPKPLMAARRGWFAGRGQSVGSRRMAKGLTCRSILDEAAVKLAVGGSVIPRMAIRTLMRPAEPAAVRRWPTLLLTEPMTQRFVLRLEFQSWVRLS